MARPQKQTVDYFPHDAVGGKTIFILQNRFGNNGYAAWFKLLALLCRTPGHFYKCSSASDWQFLVAEMALSDGETLTILNCLAELEAIDPELWKERVIWSQNLVNRLAPLYKERKSPAPAKPTLKIVNPPTKPVSPPINPQGEGVSSTDNPQTKLNETKLNESKDTPTPPGNSQPEKVVSQNIYEFFQNNFSQITPHVRDQLADMEQEYTAQWVLDAMKVAINNGKRKLSYIQGILENWITEGKGDGAHQQNIKSVPGQRPAGAFDDLD